VWVCIGGAAGSGARYAITLWTVERFGKSFPWGTLAVNIAGCLILGALMRTGEKTQILPAAAFVALTSGLMGGFTTYSSFNFEVFRMIESGHARMGLMYVGATLVGGALAGLAGYAGAKAAIA
jgi:CrcB protein